MLKYLISSPERKTIPMNTRNISNNTAFTARRMCYIALMSVLIAVCAWISVPFTVPFTMQTFGVFCALGFLGGRDGTIAVLLYILMGAVGLPVFSGGGSGVGWLMGLTGGYISGFFFGALTYWGLMSILKHRRWAMPVALFAGLLICYLFGTIWFSAVYTKTKGEITIAAILGKCVFPYVLPDCVKLAGATAIVKKLSARLLRKGAE